MHVSTIGPHGCVTPPPSCCLCCKQLIRTLKKGEMQMRTLARSRPFMYAAMFAAMVSIAIPAQAQPVTFSTFASPNNAIGIDYQPVGNRLLVSINWYDTKNIAGCLPNGGPKFAYID